MGERTKSDPAGVFDLLILQSAHNLYPKSSFDLQSQSNSTGQSNLDGLLQVDLERCLCSPRLEGRSSAKLHYRSKGTMVRRKDDLEFASGNKESGCQMLTSMNLQSS